MNSIETSIERAIDCAYNDDDAGVLHNLNQVKAQLAQLLQQNEWQPIENAPKDCAFLGYQRITKELWVIAPMYYSGRAVLMVAFHSDNSEHEMKPTHWMPIPQPPASA